MDAVSTAELREGIGIVGNADQHGARQVTLLERERWEAHMTSLTAAVDPARRRANLLISGCALANARGRVLRVGATRIEIKGETKPCERMDEAQAGLRAIMFEAWGGGAYGIVLSGGTIRCGDVVAFES